MISIVADDEHVYINGFAEKVDLSTLDPEIHAVQWNDVTGRGEVEYRADDEGRRKPNAFIQDFSPFQHLIDLWEAAAKVEVNHAA